MNLSNCKECDNWKGAGCPVNPAYATAFLAFKVFEKHTEKYGFRPGETLDDIQAAIAPCPNHTPPPKLQITLTLSSLDWKRIHLGEDLSDEGYKACQQQVRDAMRWGTPDEDDIPF